jgi:hypothetical protein
MIFLFRGRPKIGQKRRRGLIRRRVDGLIVASAQSVEQPDIEQPENSKNFAHKMPFVGIDHAFARVSEWAMKRPAKRPSRPTKISIMPGLTHLRQPALPRSPQPFYSCSSYFNGQVGDARRCAGHALVRQSLTVKRLTGWAVDLSESGTLSDAHQVCSNLPVLRARGARPLRRRVFLRKHPRTS